MARHSSAPLRSFRRNMLSPMPVQAPGFLPHLARVQRGQVHLLPDGVHLLAHDGYNLVDGAVAEKEIAVDARAELADIARGTDSSLWLATCASAGASRSVGMKSSATSDAWVWGNAFRRGSPVGSGAGGPPDERGADASGPNTTVKPGRVTGDFCWSNLNFSDERCADKTDYLRRIPSTLPWMLTLLAGAKMDAMSLFEGCRRSHSALAVEALQRRVVAIHQWHDDLAFSRAVAVRSTNT